MTSALQNKAEDPALRILFAGTPEFAVPSLQAIAREPGLKLVGILCNPDAPGKRGSDLIPPPLKKAAIDLGLDVPFLQPERLNADFRIQVSKLRPEVLVCVAYGKIFGPKFLQLFPRGGINLHPSLLPEYRGASPIQAALLDGRSQSGISVQMLGAEMDAGPILIQEERSILPEDNAQTLSERWAREGADLLKRALEGMIQGRILAQEQDHQRASYCSLIDKDMAWIDWNHPAGQIQNLVRALVPWPLAQTSFRDQKLMIHQAKAISQGETPMGKPGCIVSVDKQRGILVQTGLDLLQIQRLQLQNKKAMDWKDFINGVRDAAGTQLGGAHGSER